MNMFFHRLLPTLSVLVLLTHAAMAGNLDAGRVPADAAWVVHLDVERLKTSDIGAFLLEQAGDPATQRQLAAAQAVFDFDPRKDLKTLTAFGRNAEETGIVMLVEGVFDPERLVTLAGGMPEYAKTAHGEDAIHQWREAQRGQAMFAALPAEGQILIGRDLAVVQAALDTFRGRAPALKGRPGSFLPPASNALPLLTVGLSIPKLSPPADPATAPAAPDGRGGVDRMFRDAQSGALTISELAGEVSLDVAVDFGAVERAEQVRDLLMGFSAFAAMNAEDNPDLADLARRAQVTLEGATARLKIRMPAAKLREAVLRARAASAVAPVPPAGTVVPPPADF